jgi:hypothetical protein
MNPRNEQSTSILVNVQSWSLYIMPYGRHGIQFKIENSLRICNLYGKMIGKISLLAIVTTGPIRNDAYTTSGKNTLELNTLACIDLFNFFSASACLS